VNLAFWKMHGAGNDFVLFDDRDGRVPSSDRQWLARIAARCTGIGCDGILLIQPSSAADFRMRFFNPDGREAEMCGNGARCAARLASEIGICGSRLTMETGAGVVRADVREDGVRLFLDRPCAIERDRRLAVQGGTIVCDVVNTGVPHAVVRVDDLASCDVNRIGAAIRRHTAFAPAGTNADFITVTGPQAIRIRTYERGVEEETRACGTGIVAAALVAAERGLVRAPVTVTAAGGDRLVVDFTAPGEEDARVTLLGPATHVYRGTLEVP